MGAAVAIAIFVARSIQVREAVALRRERDLMRMDGSELERLRKENQRLKAPSVSAAELEALRADHVAVVRLRGEVEALNRRASGARP